MWRKCRYIIVLSCLIFQLQQAKADTIQSFHLSQVKLLEGPFYTAQQADLNYILEMDADRLLSPYLKDAGIDPIKQNYPNWENTGLDGHIGGHYLSALSMMYASTGNADVLDRLNYMINWLDSCQQRNGNGYIGGIPDAKAMWDDISEGEIDVPHNFSLNGHWVPLYNIHKLFAGLRDAYLYAQSEKAKTMLIKLTDWFYETTQGLSDQQVQQMLQSEHGGLNEVFADVYVITNDTKYRELAGRFSHRTILDPLLNERNQLTGLHANTQIPKVVGFQRYAEVANDSSWNNAASFFWNTVIDEWTVSIGGNSVEEHFHNPNDFGSMVTSVQGPETCNSYNMLRLTKLLYLSDPNPKYLDYYEGTLYNHILSSVHPEHGGFVYFTPMRPQHYRVYSQVHQSFWCCVGSGMENHAKYGEMIYTHNQKDVFVNFFIASTLNWEEKEIKLRQETDFPESDKTRIILELEEPKEFTIHIRKPSWVWQESLKIRVNGTDQESVQEEHSYLGVTRMWQPGDTIQVDLPMKTQIEYLPDGSDWVSFKKGPIVLAAVSDSSALQGIWADDSRFGHIAEGTTYPINNHKFTLYDVDTAKVRSIAENAFTFSMNEMMLDNENGNYVLQPFYQIHEARYIIYWPVSEAPVDVTRAESQHSIKAFPNPFYSAVQWQFTLSLPGTVELKVYDMHGKVVHARRRHIQDSGQHELEWKSHDVPTGVYYYQLAINDQLFNGKLIKTK